MSRRVRDAEGGLQMAAVGDCCIDHYQREGWFPGGNALNVAVAWERLGADPSYVGVVGDDDAGAWLTAEAGAAGLDTSFISRRSGPTGLTEIRIGQDGERHILAEHFGVSEDFALEESEIRALDASRWVHGALAPDVGELVAAFRAEGRGISYDFSTRGITAGLEGLDVAFYSWEGAPGADTHAFLESALQGGAKVAVAMCGRYGSVARTEQEQVMIEGKQISVVDTCGAGDSYIASFVLAHLEGADLEDAMRSGAAAGEQTCGHLGAWHSHQPARST